VKGRQAQCLGTSETRLELDRYKASGLRAYEGPFADLYETWLVARILDLTAMDDFVVDVLGGELGEARILDVGCGTGRLLARLAAEGGESLAGVDLAARMLGLARAKLSKLHVDVELHKADAEETLPWPSGSFDAVAITGVYHHFYHPEKALGEVARVLRTDGRLIVSDPCFFTPMRELFNLVLRVRPFAGDYHFYTLPQMLRLLSRCGWRVERAERISWWAFGAVGRPAATEPAGV
jgi:ubiquinone/menaquinone biosynthesis C-methylase UbiE